MKLLKIAVVLGKFPTVSETFIINQIGFLKDAGHHIDILCLGEKNEAFQTDNAVIKKHKLMDHAFVFKWRDLMPINKMMRIINLKFILVKSIGTRAFFNLIKSINPIKYGFDALNFHQFYRSYFNEYFEVNQYDVIHIHFADNAVQLVQQLENFKNKIIVTFHGYDAHNFDSEFFKSLLKLNNTVYTVNTEFTKQNIMRLGFPIEQISIIPVGLNTLFFEPKKEKHEGFNILFVGRLIELKAPLLAIKIVEILIKKVAITVHLNIIGEGEEFEICKQYINTNKLNSYVSLLGNKSQGEIKDFMNTSDIFLFPGIIDKNGRSEAQGLVVQEAQAMKLPVIVSDVGGIHEGMIDKKTGFVIKENDIDGFVNCLIDLIENSVKLNEMNEAAREFVIKNYDSNILGAKLLKIYNS